MNAMSIRQKFTSALDALVGQIKEDRSILAAILCGSLSHDTVWEKSDIDLVLVTIDDQKIKASDVSLNEDGVNIHAFLMPRAEFRKTVEGSTRNSFMHSLLAKGRLLYTHDPTIARFVCVAAGIGERDTELQLLRAANDALPAVDKAHKWFVTRGDLDYTALWILYAATGLARVEIIGRRLLADREVLPQALTLEPCVLHHYLHRHAQRAKDAGERPGGARRDRSLPGRACAVAVRTDHRVPARSRRGTVVQRDRSALRAYR